MNFRRIIIINTAVYAALYSFFYLIAGEKMPEEWLFRTSLLLAVFFIVGYCFCFCLPKCSLWITIFLYHLAGSFLLKEIIFCKTGDIFGLYRGDGPKYHDFAPETVGWSWNKTTYIQDLAVDDWGFPALLRGLYHWSENPEQYFSLLILANSFCVATSSFFLYQAARKLLEKQYAKIAAIIWGLSTYALFSTVHWLKENFFGADIVLALYGLLDTCEKLRGRQLLTFWGAAFLTVFFRLAVPFIFLASFCGRFISVDFVKRHILFLAVTGAFLLFILLDSFLRLLGIPGGVEWILTVSTGRIQHIGGGFAFMLLIQCLSALFGPFPNFIGQQASPFFLYNFYLLLKCLLSIYFLYGFYLLYRNKSVYFPVALTYWILNATMVVLSFVALDFRYHLTYYSLFLLLALYGFQECSLSRNTIKRRACFLSGAIGILLLIIFYNFR